MRQNAVRRERERVQGTQRSTFNHPNGVSLEVENVGTTIGVIIKNIKIGEVAQDPKLIEAVKELLHARKVIFFRDQQDVSRADHVCFG